MFDKPKGDDNKISYLKKDYPDSFVQELSTVDIRDKIKKEKNCEETKEEGIFDKNGEIKKDKENELKDIFNLFENYFNEESVELV